MGNQELPTRAAQQALDLADPSLSGKYVIVRRTVTVTTATPVEYFGKGGTEKHDRQLMTEAEILEFERDMPKEDQVQNLIEAAEIAKSEDLTEVKVEVLFAAKAPGK